MSFNQYLYAHLPARLLCSKQAQDGYLTQVHQAICWHKEFACRLNVVVLHKTHIASGRVGIGVLKSFYRVRHYLEALLKMLPDRLNKVKISRRNVRYHEQVSVSSTFAGP